jgi:hypothetical protein
VKYPKHESAPWIPGTEPQRYQWLDRWDDDPERVHSQVQEGGPGLYVVYDPHRHMKALIEAYKPWELPIQYKKPVERWVYIAEGVMERQVMSKMLNPYQYSDLMDGRLIALVELEAWRGQIPQDLINRIMMSNRSAQRAYPYVVMPASYREAELRDKVLGPKEEEFQAWNEEFSREFVERGMHGQFTTIPVTRR